MKAEQTPFERVAMKLSLTPAGEPHVVNGSTLYTGRLDTADERRWINAFVRGVPPDDWSILVRFEFFELDETPVGTAVYFADLTFEGGSVATILYRITPKVDPTAPRAVAARSAKRARK